MIPEPKFGDVVAQKLALRHQVRQKLESLNKATQAAASAQACALLRQQKRWNEARAILFYAPLTNELDISSLLTEALAAGKTVALPRFIAEKKLYAACEIHDPARDLEAGHFGVQEPVAHCTPMAIYRLDFILVPGVAFDLHGRRLGRGKGFYDLLLTAVRGTTCGVAFDEQIVREVPVEPHDIRLNCILTPTRWIEL
jgi:5-formyltetrahydrofolate cyclo-ligase